MIRNVFLNNVVQRSIVILPPSMENDIDDCLWPEDRWGGFNVAVTYHLLAEHHLNENVPNWMRIWNLDVMERVRAFMWQVSHDRILTN